MLKRVKNYYVDFRKFTKLIFLSKTYLIVFENYFKNFVNATNPTVISLQKLYNRVMLN